jgi:hypothetical protein
MVSLSLWTGHNDSLTIRGQRLSGNKESRTSAKFFKKRLWAGEMTISMIVLGSHLISFKLHSSTARLNKSTKM